MSPVMYLIRGLPGSGKSTVAKRLVVGDHYAADDHFVGDDGVYRFDPNGLSAAHKWCQDMARECAEARESVAIANTFTRRWEMRPYLDMAKEHGFRIVVVDCFDAGMTDEELAEANVHEVPAHVIESMRERYEHDWMAPGVHIHDWTKDSA